MVRPILMAPSKRLMLCTGNDLVLQRLAQITEVVAVSCHAHDQVAVLVRVLLGCSQRVGIDNVELNMVPIQPKVRSDQPHEVVQIIVVLEQLRRELLIE